MKEKISGLISRLGELPNEISKLQIAALSHNESIQILSDGIITRESEIKSEINAEIDENGKKVYSNEDARKIAFLSESKNDSTLFELYATKKNTAYDLDMVKIKIEQLSNEQRNIRVILSVINLVSEV
jgi:hypothetical protein